MRFGVKALRGKKQMRAVARQRSLIAAEFDRDFYLNRYPDVAAAGVDPIDHFLSSGWQEGRDPNEKFSVGQYLALNPDVKEAEINPFVHYLADGRRERRSTHLPGSAPGGWNPQNPEDEIAHVAQIIADAFDAKFYFDNSPKLDRGTTDPVRHYIDEGAWQGLNPSPGFSTERYLAQHAELPAKGINPLYHFLTCQRNGTGTDSDYPERRLSRAMAARYFDAHWYLQQNQDIARAGHDPLEHFLAEGWKESRNPAAWFDLDHYRQAHGHLIAPGTNPFLHYLENGRTANLSTQDTDAHEAESTRERAPLFTALTNRGLTGGNSPDEAWSSLVRKIFDNYGIQNTLARQEAERAGALPIFDGASDDGHEVSGWLATTVPLRSGEQVGLVIDGLPVASASLTNERSDVRDFFSCQQIYAITFSLAELVGKPWPSMPTSSSGNEGGSTPPFQLTLRGQYFQAMPVNEIERSGFARLFSAGQLAEQIYEGRFDDPLPSRENMIALVARHLDLAHYRTQSRIAFSDEQQAAEHYVAIGAAQNINPTPWFDTAFYAESLRGREARLDPFYHYLKIGRPAGREARDANSLKLDARPDECRQLVESLFDTDFYLGMNPDVAQAGIPAFEHYMNEGWHRGRDPSPRFSSSYYLDQNPDLAAAGVNPFEHYILRGRNENRRPHPHFFSLELPMAEDPRRERQVLHLPGAHEQPPALLPTPGELRIAVHLHVYFTDLLPGLLEYIERIPYSFVLYLTTDTSDKAAEIEALMDGRVPLASSHETIVEENRGRDVLPMLRLMKARMGEHDLVLHAHTKKSDHLGDYGLRWSRQILDNLIGSTATVTGIVDYFATDPGCGITYPEASREHAKYVNWGVNKPIARTLLDRLGIHRHLLDDMELDFPVGNMMWFRPTAIAQLFGDSITTADFPAEPIGVDGTVAHTIERCMPHIAAHNGFGSLKTTIVKPACLPQANAFGYQLSIIIPMLDCERWLHDTIGSTIRQGSLFPQCQIVLVDNGSSDATLQIAQFYARQYQNIMCLEEPTPGAGNARNTGMRAARGYYITFLDADDLLVDGALQELYSVACESQADLVTSQLRMFNRDSFQDPMPGYSATSSNRVLDIAHLSAEWNNYFIGEEDAAAIAAQCNDFGPCAKLYRREFLEDLGISFSEGTNYEDNVFVFKAYLNARRLVPVKTVSYLYRKYRQADCDTQSSRVDEKTLNDLLAVQKELLALVDAVGNQWLKDILGRAIANRSLDILLDERMGDSMRERFQTLITTEHRS